MSIGEVPTRRLGPEDAGRPLSAQAFREGRYAEPWRYEREAGNLIVMAPDSREHDDCSETLRDHLGAYRLAHLDLVDRVVSESWIRVLAGTDRIADIAVYLRDPTAAKRPDRVPDLIIEVVSSDRDSRERGYVKKRREYRQLGVAEHVILDRFRRRMTVYRRGPHGEIKQVIRPGQFFQTPLLPGFVIDTGDVF